MGEINREGVLKLVTTVLDVAEMLKDTADTWQETAEEPSEGSSNEYAQKPVGTVIWMKDNDVESDSGYLHFKVGANEWLEFSVNTFEDEDGRVSVKSSGKNPDDNVECLARSCYWTAKVLTEDA